MTTIPIYKPQYVGPPSFFSKQPNNNKISYASNSMPFKPNTMTQGNEFTVGRAIYSNVEQKPKNILIKAPCTYTSKPRRAPQNLPGMGCNKLLVNDIEYFAKKTLLANHSSSDVVARKKAIAIGKGSGMKNNSSIQPVSFAYSNNGTSSGPGYNTVNSALKKCRGGGCVAPPKKGALGNTFKSGGGCC